MTVIPRIFTLFVPGRPSMPFFVRLDSATATLHSSVKGVLSAAEVEEWSVALDQSLSRLPDAAQFRFLSDLHGYEVSDQDLAVHRRMREIGPRFLAAHGLAVGFWRLYEETPPEASRSRICIRVAHVHHSCEKMERYNEVLASPTERFFCDPTVARAWLGNPH